MKSVKVKIRLSKVDCAILDLQKCQSYQELSQHTNQLIDRLIKSGSLKIIITKLFPSEELNLLMETASRQVSISEDCQLVGVGTLFLKAENIERLSKYGIDISSTVIKKLIFIGNNYSLPDCIKLSKKISIAKEDNVIGDDAVGNDAVEDDAVGDDVRNNAVGDDDNDTAESKGASSKQVHKPPQRSSKKRTVGLPRQLVDSYNEESISKVFREKLHSLSSVTIVNDVLPAKCTRNNGEDCIPVQIMLSPNDIRRVKDILAEKNRCLKKKEPHFHLRHIVEEVLNYKPPCPSVHKHKNNSSLLWYNKRGSVAMKKSCISYSGSKNERHFNAALGNLFEKLTKDTTVIETCIGGNGIQPYQYKKFEKYIISDYDDTVLALYYYISNEPYLLKNTCDSLNRAICGFFANRQNHVLEKKLYELVIAFARDFLAFQKEDLAKVVCLMLEKASSQQNRDKISLKRYMELFEKNCNNIFALHGQLFKATILNKLPKDQRDLLHLVTKHSKRKDELLLIDPPYYLTDKIYNLNQPSYSYHEELAKLLHKVKGKFCLFLRINASRANNSKDNDAVDDALLSFYRKFYYGKGCFVYCDNFDNDELFINYRSNGTYEVMITNFSYTGAHELETVFDKYEQIIQKKRLLRTLVRLLQLYNNSLHP